MEGIRAENAFLKKLRIFKGGEAKSISTGTYLPSCSGASGKASFRGQLLCEVAEIPLKLLQVLKRKPSAPEQEMSS